MTDEEEHPIRASADAQAAPERARARAKSCGFADAESEEIALVVRELALNVLHHGGEGSLVLRILDEGERTGLEVEALNLGPVIPDVEEAFRDGYSTRGSFGYGLGTVNRLMHLVEVESPRAGGTGTRVVARRWLYGDPEPAGGFLDAGVASRPRLRTPENGDAVVITSWANRSLVGVIDGLGHGRPAMLAAKAARAYILGHAREPLEQIFRGVDRACRGTRGVVMALVRFNWAEETVTVGNVGNVELRVFGTPERLGLPVRRGFLGRRAPRAPVRTTAWPREATMVAHTDGIRASEIGDAYRELEGLEPRRLARALLLRLAVDRDDATVAVLKRRDE